MDLKDFTDLGSGIGRRVNDAINSMNFDRLNSDIRDEINQVFGKEPEFGGLNGKLYREPAKEEKRAPVKNRKAGKRNFYSGGIPINPKIPGKVSGIVLLIAGIVLALSCGIPALVFGVLGGTLSSVGMITYWMFSAAAVGLFPLAVAGIVMAAVGAKKYKRTRRFKLYLETMGNSLFCAVKDLAAKTGKSTRFVLKDLEKMMKQRFFLEGHLDDAKTCFMATDEIYMQYVQARDSAAESVRVQHHREEPPEEEPMDRDLEAVIREGEAYIATVRDANDAIYNVEISDKLYRMEVVLEKIFDYVRKNPNQIGQLRRFMNYYMPITEKLVRAYQDMDRHSIEGENIAKAKSEISQTLDTINEAYEKLYDSMYAQVAMDVSSDIAVLKTLFAQEGLSEKEIKGERK